MNEHGSINKVITKSGDYGLSDLPTCSDKISKNSVIFHCIGAIDEANANIGLAREMLKQQLDDFEELLDSIQNNLFDLAADVIKITNKITSKHVEYITQYGKKINQNLPPLESFVLPKGPSSALHVARASTRKAEREYWALYEKQNKKASDKDTYVPYPGMYLNRLSDILFILGRYVHCSMRDEEQVWHKIK